MKGFNFSDEKYVDEFRQWRDMLLMSYPGRFVSETPFRLFYRCVSGDPATHFWPGWMIWYIRWVFSLSFWTEYLFTHRNHMHCLIISCGWGGKRVVATTPHVWSVLHQLKFDLKLDHVPSPHEKQDPHVFLGADLALVAYQSYGTIRPTLALSQGTQQKV